LAKNIENPNLIKAVSIVSASGNTVLLDNEQKPLGKAINWTDRRFDDEADKVLEYPDYRKLYKITGWPFYNTFPLAHLSWLKVNEPGKLADAGNICMVTDYVNYRLTNKLASNPSTATTFYLAEQKKSTWSDEILKKLAIPKDKLPEIVPTGTKIGQITTEAAKNTGLREGTPVIAGAFDHPGAARATGILKECEVLLSCGTSWVGFYPYKNRDTLISLEMLVDPFLKEKGIWGGMFSIPMIGNNIDCLIRKWINNGEDRYEVFNKSAEASSPGASGLSINPMKEAEKDFSSYGKPMISRAIMEGAARLMKSRIDYYAVKGLSVKKVVLAGGPTRSKLWMDILCDILGTEINVAGSHAGAKGAAVIAGIGIGVYRDEFDAFNKISGGE
jgi:sugar (pentulose or hexulose) kinase